MKPLCSFLVGLVTVCSAAQLSAATVTNLNDSGPGSLRAALAADGNIEFTVTGTILLTSGQLEVNRPVTITGPGVEHLTIARSSADGTPEFRVFLVHGAPVTISGLTIKNGLVGPIYDSGAGIRNEGMLTLNDCVVRGNRSTGEYTRGTGLFNANEATLTANRCRFIENIGSGDYAEGGGIYVFGQVTLNDSTFSGNRGGGHYSRGGGLHVDYFGRAGVARCTFSSNSVAGDNAQGGAIYNYGRLEIVNSTLSGNYAGGSGGGLHVDGLAPSTAIRNCTISGNTAPAGAGLANFGMSPGSSTPRTVKDSIIAGNSPGDIENAGIITSLGRNLYGLLSGTPIPPGPGDQFGLTADAMHMGPLANNGGPTLTRALLAGSPAIDAGSEAGFPTTDQRGVARPFGPRPDIGAFELDVILPPLVTVSATQSKTIEAGPTVFPPPGEFTLRRSGNTNESLQVFFRLSGTASNGLDYTYVSNSVVIPAGRTSATLLITGLFDGLVEGTETVVLHLEAPECAAIYPPPPGCYLVGFPAEAVVEIQDYEHPTNQPPTITFVSPSNGYSSTAPANIMLIMTVNDPDGTVANAVVEFFSGTNKLGNGQLFDPGPPHEAPFRFYWTNVPPGEYTLMAKVTDEKGAMAVSDSRRVIVRSPPPPPNQWPTVTLVAPTNGAIFTAPAEIQICADARDLDGYVDRVEFFAVTNSIGSRTNCLPCASPQNPFCLVWTNVPPGQYALRAVATDDKGATTLSEPVTITVFDAVLSRVTLRATDDSASEAGDPGTFTISREGNTNSALQVFYSIGGTAANGVDYVALSNSIFLAEGVQTATIQITPIDDALFEGAERVELRLLPPPFYLFPYYVGSPSNAVVNIADNDQPLPKPVVTIEATDPTASETPGNPGLFRIHRTGPTNESLQLSWALTGSASNGLDYVWLTNKVVIPAGQSAAEFVVTPIDDNLFEGTESVIATLYYPPVAGPGVFSYVIGTPSNAVVNITDNDEQPRPVVTIEAADAVASEAPGNPGQFKIRRSGPTNTTLSILLAISGTSSNGMDYARITNHVVLLAGRTVVELPVLPIDDNLSEGTETVVASLYYPPIPGPLPLPYTIGSPSNATVTILDNDEPTTNRPPVVRIHTPTNDTTFTAPANILICTTPEDGDEYVATVEFFAGDTSLGIQTNTCIPPECVHIAPETFCLMWSNVPPGNYTLTAKATDNHGASSVSPPVHVSVFPPPPKPVITIEAADAAASEAPGNPGQFKIRRTGPTNQAIYVYLAISGTASNGVDYARLTNLVILSAGRTVVELPVTPIDDTLFEGTESVVATLYYPPIAGPEAFPYTIGSPSNAVVNIADNDEPTPKPVVTIQAGDMAASETPGHPGQFRLLRSGPTNLTLSVYLAISGSASNGLDYARITNMVTIPAGKTAVELLVSPIDDSLVEGDETVVAALYVPPINSLLPYNIGSPSNAIVTILDNDPSPYVPAVVTVEASDAQAAEGGSVGAVNPGVFTLHRSGNTNATLYVQCVVDGTASNGLDYVAISNLVIIPAGATSAKVYVYPSGDNLVEGTEIVALRLQTPACITIYPPPPECYQVGTPSAAMVFISDHSESNALPVVTLTATDPIASEGTNCFRWVGWSNPPPTGFCGTNTATFVFRRTGSTNASLSIAYEIGGTASNGVDYTELPGHITIPAGSRAAEIKILPVDDTLREGNETVVLALTAPLVASNSALPYLVGSPRRAGAVIVDNDQPRPTTGPLSDHGFHLMHPGTNGTWFRIECSTNFIHWTALCTNVVTDGAIHFVDPDAASSASRFYRAALEPNPPEEARRPLSINAQEMQ